MPPPSPPPASPCAPPAPAATCRPRSATPAGVASLVPNAPLAYNTVYTATVAASVADLAGNQLGTAATWSFTTEPAPLSTLTDTSLADFGAGTFSNTYLADESGGEVILAPSVGAEFGGSSLPAGWTQNPTPWASGGTVSVSGGQMALDGRAACATNATFGPRDLARICRDIRGPAASALRVHQRRRLQFAMDRGRARAPPANGVFARAPDANQQRGIRLEPGCSGLGRTAIAWCGPRAAFEFYVDGGTVPVATLSQHRQAGHSTYGGSDLDSGGSAAGHRLGTRVALSGGRQLHLARVRRRQHRGLAAAQPPTRSTPPLPAPASKCAAATWPRPMPAGAASCRSLAAPSA